MLRGLQDETIFAVASGAGRAALSVLRISGPTSGAVLSGLCATLPPPRRASVRALHGPDGTLLDRAIVLWFPGPDSYTGEDSGELHLHGGAAVLGGVVEALVHLGARPAEPGAFTRRAVVHGRMDLLEAEAVADLVDADTALQRDQAMRQLGGQLSAVYGGWAASLLRLLAQQEALIDFPDEALPPEVEVGLLADIATLEQEIGLHLQKGARGERLRTGLVFAVTGPPNAGKSSLVNALCERDFSIVSAQPGTTRDVLEVRIEIAGVPVTLLDTAGLRETEDAIEAEGVRRARARMAEADLIIVLQAADDAGTDGEAMPAGPRVLQVTTKIDLLPPTSLVGLAISVRTGDGMAALRAALEAATRDLAGGSTAPVFTRARHRAALEAAGGHLHASLAHAWPELRGEELRLAAHALGRLTGAVGVEDVLDSVFGQFCIGK